MSALPASFPPLLSAEDTWQTRQSIRQHYLAVRQLSQALCQPLAVEDYVIQSMPDTSPPKWHLAHTSWFFENFLLRPHLPHYPLFHPRFGYLFNSYYETIGSFHPRPQRGLLSRPTVEDIYAYRAHVDGFMGQLLDSATAAQCAQLEPLLTLGLHHEQQHQELLLTDIKHIFASNPLRPAYRTLAAAPGSAPANQWLDYSGGIQRIGHDGSGFRFDNELPSHRVFLEDYRLAASLVTNGQYREFIEAGGYEKAQYWLSEGWRAVRDGRWQAPLYWEWQNNEIWLMSLSGLRKLDEAEPVCHISYFEADAFARWAGRRLPTEAEWEHAATGLPVQGNLLEADLLHPAALSSSASLNTPAQLFGDVWEWTASPYAPYPGYRQSRDALGEYNGKFMCNQMVLRGASCVTSTSHARASYRNFFPADARWQFSGLRLAEDA